MNIVGYAALNHDPAIAVVRDGVVLCAIESEKVTRHKREVSVFPEETLRFALRTAGVAWEDVAAIAVNYDAGPIANRGYLPHAWRLVRARSFDLGVILNVIALAGSHHERMFRRAPEYRVPPIVRVRHHLAHVASAFLFSPFDEAAVAVIDAAGELECTSLYRCAGRRIDRLGSMDLPSDSLGFLYMMATRHLGYQAMGDEYKVMGLAPYGGPNPRFRAFFTELVALLPDGRYRVAPRLAGRIFDNGWKFPEDVARRIGGARAPGQDITDEHKDFAFELQRRLEEAVLHVVRHLRVATGARRLCLAGGVALNSVANGKICEDAGFDEVYIPSAPHDAGTALGAAAYHAYYRLGGARPAPLAHAYLGPSYDDAAVERELVRCRQAYRRVDDPAAVAAELVAGGAVIGWFQGATEFGHRALGNRSIVADPRPASMKDRVNQLVKEREGYRPFAPAVLAEHAERYFARIACSPFMARVGEVRPERRAEIAAVVHTDGTARPQTVDRATNPRFHALISAFHARTGVPAVLNTSFNVAGEPIVNAPVDALRCFHGSGLDALVIGKLVLQKP